MYVIFNLKYFAFYYILIFLFSYHKKHDFKDSDATSFFYKCSQSLALKKRPRKHENSAVHRDRPAMKRFECNGMLRITVNSTTTIAKIAVSHEFAHSPS